MMKKNPYEREEKERLTTTDQDGHRVFLYPEDTKGIWTDRRKSVYFILVFIYLVTPWIEFNNKQIILLNLANREFIFFGHQFWGHDVPLLFLVIAIFGVSLALLTTLFGRAWCGWACPQTVFIDSLYRFVERKIEGNARARKKLDESPMTSEKFLKKGFKWFLFLVISLNISHSFLAYFVGSQKLLYITLKSPAENWTLFITAMSLTGLLLFDFGWFKEQFCLIACPYGRFQSVFTDKDSLIVAYDHKRGEPRKVKKESNHADCIDCFQCVRVCPTGIDIRDGNQLECIGCTMCIDACDLVMKAIHRPKGLIRYASERELEGGERKILRPRLFLYIGIFISLIFISLYSFSSSKELRAIFLRASHTPYETTKLDNHTIITNHYKVDLLYSGDEKLKLQFKVRDNKEIELITPMVPFELNSTRKKTANIFFKFKPSALNSGIKRILVDIYNQDKLIESKEISLVGPVR